MIKYYAETRGVLIRKYKNLLGQYILVFEENGKKAKVCVSETIHRNLALGTRWTIGHIGRKLINIRPGFCKNTDK